MLRWRAAQLLGLITTTACGGVDAQILDLSAESGIGFVVRTGDDGARAVAAGPFGLEDGRLSFGTRPQLRADAAARDEVLLVPIDALEAAVPGWRMSDGPAVALLADAPPVQDRLRPDGKLITRVAMPRETKVWRTASGASPEPIDAPILTPYRLDVPFDPEHCRPQAQDAMTRWGSEGMIAALDDGMNAVHLRNVAVVDADRIVAHSYTLIFALTRTDVLQAEDAGPPFRAIDAGAALGFGLRVQAEDVAVDPRTTVDPTVLALVIYRNADDEIGSAILRARFEAGGLVDVRTATITPKLRLRAITVAPDGRWLAAGDQGVLFGHLDEAQMRHGPPPPALGDSGHSVAVNPDPSRPWIVSGDNQLHTYDAVNDRWITERIEELTQETVRFRGLAATLVEGRTQAWAGAHGGRLYLAQGGGAFQRQTLQMPPRIGACTEQLGAPRPEYSLSVDDMRADAETLFVVSDECSVVLQVRLTDQCTSALGFGDLGIQGGVDFGKGIDVRDGQMVVVGERGAIWEAPTR